MKIQTTSTVLLTVILAPLLLTFQAAADTSTIPDPRFGVVEAYQAPDAATALGAGWTRVTFRWNEIQPNGPGEWNVLPISDEMLSGELSRGRQVVGLLVTTPGWATDLAVGPGVPRSLHLPTDDPKNLWAGFVRTIVNRYAGRIDHWIVWNEPDIPGTHHMSWGGSVEDFVRLLQVAYTVARDTNPDAVIHLPAVTHWWNEDWFGDFLAALVDAPNAATNDYYFDVATLHVYFQPETVYDITVHYRDMMLGYGMVKPIWIGETNAAPSQDTAWPVSGAQFNVSLEQQAAYIVQAFSLGIAAGAERIAVYKMADTEADRQANPEPFGLVRQDGSRRPAFRAYQAATTYLSGYRTARWERRDTIATVTVDRGDRTTTVLWSRTPEAQTAMVPARATRGLLVDARGTARHVYPERGYYYVDLPGAHCPQGCMIGGEPYMLVETAPVAADTAPTPQPPVPTTTHMPASDASVTPTETLPWTMTPSPSPTATSTTTPRVRETRTATVGPTPCATPSCTPVHAATPTATTLPRPTPLPTPSPSSGTRATPTPSPPLRSLVAHTANPDRPVVLIGVLAMILGGAALTAQEERP